MVLWDCGGQLIDAAYLTSQVQGDHLSVFDASFAVTCHSDKNAQPEIAEGRDVKWLRTKKNMHQGTGGAGAEGAGQLMAEGRTK